MRIYHGSKVIIENPQLEKGNLYNDFGQGFYCTDDIEKAKQWACRIDDCGIVNEYDLNIDKLKVLDLTKNEYNILNWIAILMKNRRFYDNNELAMNVKKYIIDNFLIDTSKYDVVIGYRADDSYFSFARSFVSNSLSISNLEKALKLGNLGKQIVLISKKSFKNITFKNSYNIMDVKYHNEFVESDQKAREEYKKITSKIVKGTYAIDLMRMEVKNKDERLSNILSK